MTTGTVKRLAVALGGVGLVALAAGAPLPAQAEETVTVVAFGGAPQAALRKAYFEPFMKETGINLREDEWGSRLAKLQVMVQSGNVTWDVVDMGSTILNVSCDQGLIQPLDISLFGGKDLFVENGIHECGIAASISANIIGYDATKLPGGKPTTKADFWDVEKFPGKRGMRRRPQDIMELALMADGVPAEKVYEVLGTDEGVTRALRKLGEIKPHVVWFSNLTQGLQLLIDGEVVMTKMTNHRLLAASGSHPRIKLLWDGGTSAAGWWTIAAGAKNKQNAIKFLQYVNTHDNQVRLPPIYPYGVPLKSANAALPPEVASRLASHPDNAKMLLNSSPLFWADHLEDYDVRFQAWLSK